STPGPGRSGSSTHNTRLRTIRGNPLAHRSLGQSVPVAVLVLLELDRVANPLHHGRYDGAFKLPHRLIEFVVGHVSAVLLRHETSDFALLDHDLELLHVQTVLSLS